MNTTTASGFVRSHRPNSRSPWHPVCRGDSAEVALTKLLHAIKGSVKCRRPLFSLSHDGSAPAKRESDYSRHDYVSAGLFSVSPKGRIPCGILHIHGVRCQRIKGMNA